jgi:hypothetical protein
MKKNVDNLEDFICALSFQHNHYLENPILLLCEHAACTKCIDDLKNNAVLKEVKCLKCNKENNLEINYNESNLIKNLMTHYSDKILASIIEEYEETLGKVKGKFLIK